MIRISRHLLDLLRYHLKRPKLTLVTAADETHARSLEQFLKSAQKNHQKDKMVIIDLGLSDESVQRLQKIDLPSDIRRFNYSKYPAWFDVSVNAGEYAWKPIIINDIVQEQGGVVSWMDAGNMILGKLWRLQAHALKYGLFSQGSSGDLARWTHPATLSYFNKDIEWAKGKRNINGACIAVYSEHPTAKSIVPEWARLATIREAIAPIGSNRQNHRQDQALLSVLLNLSGRIPNSYSQKSLNFATHKDVE